MPETSAPKFEPSKIEAPWSVNPNVEKYYYFFLYKPLPCLSWSIEAIVEASYLERALVFSRDCSNWIGLYV